MLPVVVICGRPNVGKSTLFNRLVGRRLAIVDDIPGVTRDRKEAEALLRGRRVKVIDTAGLEEAPPESMAGRMSELSARAVADADLVLFVVDARAGITPVDAHFASWLRKQNRPVLVLANKSEGRASMANALEAYELGLGDLLAVSAEHGEGIADLMSEVADRLPPEKDGAEESEGEAGQDRPLRLTIVGRPNAGKSTLVNRLLGEERMLTGPEPGLTRDAIESEWRDRDGRRVKLVDTAGMRKRARVEERLERAAVGASIESLKMAEVVVLAVDATQGLNEQDLQIARLVEREGRALVLALTKWDAVENRDAARKAVTDRMQISLAQLKGLSVVTLSGLTGSRVDRLMPAVWAAYDVWNRRVPTGALNRWFEEALERHPPPLVEGRRLKLRYITQAKSRPPTFIVFGTRAEATPEDWRRYLSNGLRETFDLPGTPIRIEFRGTANPFADQGR